MIDFNNYGYERRAIYVRNVLSLLQPDIDYMAIDLMKIKKGDRGCGIYGIFNVKTKGLYIGSTTDYHKRMIDHLNQIKNGRSWATINSDMLKTGYESFIFIKVHEVSKEELIPAENYWMKYLNATYNTRLAVELKIPIESKRAARKNGINTLNYYSSPVIKKSLSGKFIKEYTSIRAAAVEHGGKHLAYLITKVCRGKKENAFDAIWEYKNGLTPPKPKWVKSLIEKPIVQINPKTGDFMKLWDSSIEAGAFYGLKAHSIRRVTKSNKEAAGFIWRYANINTFKII